MHVIGIFNARTYYTYIMTFHSMKMSFSKSKENIIMRNKPQASLIMLMAVLFSFLVIVQGTALAAPLETATPITGEIEFITINTLGNVWSGGTMTVGGQIVILPANLLINLPNDYQTLQQLYTNAPTACLTTGETGLAKCDKCNARATGAQVSILANRVSNGNVIAGQVDIFKAVESVSGDITYIDYTNGFFRLDGIPGDSTTGVMVRVNDPPVGPLPSAGGRHTVQVGPGCAAGNTVNCSPDTRFKIDPDNYTFAYITGYPACIPVTANGLGDANCPDTNRPAPPLQTLLSVPAPIVAADSRRFAPLQLGDSVKADGSFETIGAVTFLSASSVRVFVDLTTRTLDPNTGLADLTQPDYLIINEAGWDGASYPAGRVRGRFLTNSSLRGTEIDYFSIHYDPTNNAAHERLLYTTQFNKQQGAVAVNGNTGVFDSQIRFDFMPAAKILGNEPCIALRQGVSFDPKKFLGTPAIKDLNHNLINVNSYCTSATAGTAQDLIDNFNLMVPAFREVMARSIRQHVATGQALDIHGRAAQSGQYKLPTVLAYGAFEDINLGMSAFPVQFMGTPWLRDRRLSPNGCVGACEVNIQPLSPFPYEGIDPRVIAPTFGFTGTVLPTPNQMFAFVDAAGNMTGNLGFTAPANVGLPAIVPTPALNMFPPLADEDAAVTTVGNAVTIPVLANDVAMFGTIEPLSVAIVTPPASGTATVNLPAGTITYTPAVGFPGGIVTFTYTVANNYGAVSLPGTVTVTIQRPPVAVNDSASTPINTTIPINLVTNDSAGTSSFNLGSVTIVSNPTCGSLVNQLNGTVLFTAPSVTGTCTFSYTISDISVPALLSNVATATVTIIPPIPPVAVNDTASTVTLATAIINVIANDSSAASTLNPASLSVTAPTGGTATTNTNGTISYTAPATPGVYTFFYRVNDNNVPPLTSNIATVTVTVAQGHVPPVANNDPQAPLSIPVNTTIIINVIANDTADTGSAINPTSLTVTAPTGGTASALPNGTVSYTAPATPGNYTFTYTVKDNFVPATLSNVATVTVTVIAAPPAANNDAATATVNTIIPINVVANDTATAPAIINPASVVVTVPTGGTAVANANGTVTYTAPATPGTYTFTYTVKDNEAIPLTSNSGTVTVTVVAAATGVSLVPSSASPQAPLTPITFIAAGSGGSGSYEYQFSTRTGGNPYAVTRAYSSANSWIWTPAATGPYDIKVDVRNAGSTSASDASGSIFFYQIESSATSVTIVPNLAAPQTPGTAITFTATATGGSGPYEYRFWVNTGNGYAVVQEYNAANTWVFTPVKPGIYDILVDVRGQGSTVFRNAFTTLLAYQVSPAPATAVTLTTPTASPRPVGTPITFTATASGGTGPYEYRFWINIGGTYLIAQDYTTINTFTWTPLAAGNYDIMVDTRAVGSTLFREALTKIFFYQIQ
jgi:hypothetical protein